MAEKSDETEVDLELEYEAVMEEMVQDPNLDKFRSQFEQLHGAWKDSKDSNARLQVWFDFGLFRTF